MKDRLLYYQPHEIPIENKTWIDTSKQTYLSILNHEISGLIALGSDIQVKTGWTVLRNKLYPSNKFLNRILDIHCKLEDVHELLAENIPTIEVNQYSNPNGIEDILSKNGISHANSFYVLGKQIIDSPKKSSDTNLDSQYSIKPLVIEDLLNILAISENFLVKNGEDTNQAISRIENNLSRGPHFISYYKNLPVGMLGAIIHNDIGCLYSGFVDPKHRTSNTILFMAKKLEEELIKRNVNFIYSKSNNKAVVLGARFALGMRILYADRIYEKPHLS